MNDKNGKYDKVNNVALKVLAGLLIGIPVAIVGVLFTLLVEELFYQAPGLSAIYGFGIYLSCVIVVCTSIILRAIKEIGNSRNTSK